MFSSFLMPRAPAERGSISDASVIGALGFGRNTFSDKDLSEKLEHLFEYLDYPEKVSSPSRFAILQQEGFDPGDVNRAIARRIRQYAETIKVVVGQWEVMYALCILDPRWYLEQGLDHFFVIWPNKKEGYLSTKLALEQMRSACLEGEKILLLAHRHHLARVVRTADKIFEPEQIIVPPAGPAIYDHRSVQKWTKNSRSFAAYEKKQRIIEKFPDSFQEFLRRQRS